MDVLVRMGYGGSRKDAGEAIGQGGDVRVYRGTGFSRVPGMSGSLEVEVLCTA